MKTIKFFKAFLVLFALITIASCSKDKDKTIQPGDIPAEAATIIDTYFPDAAIKSVKKDIDQYSKYEVKLDNGFEIEFDTDGNWTEIEGHGEQIPDGLIPPTILTYVQDNHPDTFIEEIDRKRNGYKVDLAGDVDLLFDKDGNFTGIDQ